MIFKLRDYQTELCDLVLNDPCQKIILQAPTGAGKTVLASYLIDHYLQQNKRVFFVVNRKVLINQTKVYFNNDLSIVKAGMESDFYPERKLQLIMIHTFHARELNIKAPDVIIVDECHQGIDGSMMTKLLGEYPNARVIGLSATPITEKGLKLPFFEKVISKYQTIDLIERGYLSPFKFLALPLKSLNLKAIATSSTGDYVDSQLSHAMLQKEVLYSVMTAVRKYINHHKTLVFCVDIKHANAVYEEMKSEGYSCGLMHSKLDDMENDQALKDFKLNKIQFLISVSMLTTGFDVPDVTALVVCRPTKILRLALQIFGRGLRTAEGKSHCLILDCGKLYYKHGLPDEIRDWTKDQKIKDEELETLREKQLCHDCDLALINLRCPQCEVQYYNCKRCKEHFKKDFFDGGICFTCIAEIEAKEKEEKKKNDRQIQREFELVEMKKKMQIASQGSQYFYDDGDECFKMFKQIVRQHPKSSTWKRGAENYRYAKLLKVAEVKGTNIWHLESILKKAMDKKYAPDWCLYQIDKDWKQLC